jgi:23S rRNA (guanosine2251-2'-O)-methyltransferase
VVCPLCKTATLLASERCEEPDAGVPGKPAPLSLLLDNVRSVFNVGSMFRSADGSGATHLYLGGITPTPEHKAMRKTALGAEESISWSAHRNSVTLAEELASGGHTLWALERTKGSQDLFAAATERPEGSLVLVLGNEVAGVDPGILPHCERCIHIPMHGNKASLNVATAMGIAAYALG